MEVVGHRNGWIWFPLFHLYNFVKHASPELLLWVRECPLLFELLLFPRYSPTSFLRVEIHFCVSETTNHLRCLFSVCFQTSILPNKSEVWILAIEFLICNVARRFYMVLFNHPIFTGDFWKFDHAPFPSL